MDLWEWHDGMGVTCPLPRAVLYALHVGLSCSLSVRVYAACTFKGNMDKSE